ncbi:MAG: hypothetical protein J6X55_04295 [Victivallales bacterium]|nr:hypothetical protein [Victivallales bacterium]
MSRHLKDIIGFLVIIIVCLETVHASSLDDYFDSVSGVIPNTIKFSVSQEAMYRDNINSSPDKKDAFEFVTGLTANWMRTFSNLMYGVEGKVEYTYLTEEPESSQDGLEWSLNPKIIGSETFHITTYDRVMVSLNSSSSKEKWDDFDSEYVRRTYYRGNIVYDLIGLHRIGFTTTLYYHNLKYDDKDYKDYSRQRYGFSVSPYYKLTHRIRTGIRFEHTETEYINDKRRDDSTKIGIFSFANYMITARVNATLQAGLTRIDYEGRSKDSDNSGEFVKEYSFRMSYAPTDKTHFIVRSVFQNDDTYDTNRGCRYEWDNFFIWVWEFTSRFSLDNTFGIENKDEKNKNTRDVTEYSYKCRLTYDLTSKCSVFTGYEMNNLRYKYRKEKDYTENVFRLGFSYHF